MAPIYYLARGVWFFQLVQTCSHFLLQLNLSKISIMPQIWLVHCWPDPSNKEKRKERTKTNQVWPLVNYDQDRFRISINISCWLVGVNWKQLNQAWIWLDQVACPIKIRELHTDWKWKSGCSNKMFLYYYYLSQFCHFLFLSVWFEHK